MDINDYNKVVDRMHTSQTLDNEILENNEKNSNFPNKKEWKKIVRDAFSSNENHVFSEKYNKKKNL